MDSQFMKGMSELLSPAYNRDFLSGLRRVAANAACEVCWYVITYLDKR